MPTLLTAGGLTVGAQIVSSTDGAITIQSGPDGSKVNALAIDASGNTTAVAVNGTTMQQGGVAMPRMVLSNSVATTSGTTVSVATGLPSWVKRITLNFVGISTSGTAGFDIRLGYGATTWVNTGYAGASTIIGASSVATSRSTTGCFMKINAANATCNGQVVIELQTGTSWTFFGSIGDSTNDQQYLSAYSLALGNTLTGVQLATANGTDTFDAGSVNILYEG